eukprot:853091-Prymnesium_polylepis.1
MSIDEVKVRKYPTMVGTVSGTGIEHGRRKFHSNRLDLRYLIIPFVWERENVRPAKGPPE